MIVIEGPDIYKHQPLISKWLVNFSLLEKGLARKSEELENHQKDTVHDGKSVYLY